jgi:hypothetical protein
MKRNFDAPLTDFDGKPFEDGSTLKTICMAALVSAADGDQQAKGEDKVKLFQLAQRIHAGGVIDVTSEDIATLKGRIGKLFGVVAVGRAFELLEADFVPPAGEL